MHGPRIIWGSFVNRHRHLPAHGAVWWLSWPRGAQAEVDGVASVVMAGSWESGRLGHLSWRTPDFRLLLNAIGPAGTSRNIKEKVDPVPSYRLLHRIKQSLFAFITRLRTPFDSEDGKPTRGSTTQPAHLLSSILPSTEG